MSHATSASPTLCPPQPVAAGRLPSCAITLFCLAGPIPLQWANLSLLASFNASLNQLTGEIPAVFAPNLASFSVPANKVYAWGVIHACQGHARVH